MQEAGNKILYVEDDRIDQFAFENFIKKENLPYAYKIAGSVSAAKRMLAEENFDAVLVDHNLGDGTGFEVFGFVTNHAPIIFITSEDDSERAVKGMKAGAYDYLIKDLDRNYLNILPTTLENAIAHSAVKRRLFSAEREIKQLSWAISKINNAVMITDRFGKIIWVNEGFTNFSGYSLAEVENTSAEILRRGEKTGLSPGSVHYEMLMKEKKPVSYETKNYSKEGREYWVMCTLTPALNEKGEVEEIIAIDTDITKIKRIEEDLILANKVAENSLIRGNKALEELQEAKEKIEKTVKIKEQFMANMSHEIRTPMNAIVGFTDLMLKTPLSPEQKQYVDAVKTSGENLIVIINDILDFSKLQSGKISFEHINFSLSKVMSEITELMLPKSAEKNIKLSCIIDKNIPDRLNGDPTRLNQIILNLVSNSIKFTETGEVKISVNLLSENKGEAELKFSVADTGIGIPENKLDSIFSEFTQANNDTARIYGGSGLGLSIVKQLVEMQGGKVSVESKERVGSSFFVQLKFNRNLSAKETEENLSDEQGEILSTEELNVLLVEDNMFNQVLAKKVLSDWNWKVEVADNGTIAINKLKERDFDIILMDMQMPEMDGYEATAYIRKKIPKPKCNIPIMAMTAHAMASEEEKCRKMGMNGYISKPFDQKVLYRKIMSVLNACGYKANHAEIKNIH